MYNASEYAKASLPPSTAATIQSLIDSLRGWLYSFLDLVALEGKQAGIGLALMLGFGLGATVLLGVGWLALVGCAIAAMVENNVLGLTWSLLLVALLHFAGAAGLMFLAIRRSQDLLFSASRRQLGLMSASTSRDA
jgi:hypothetical protein